MTDVEGGVAAAFLHVVSRVVVARVFNIDNVGELFFLFLVVVRGEFRKRRRRAFLPPCLFTNCRLHGQTNHGHLTK